jgi:hypothetical protein
MEGEAVMETFEVWTSDSGYCLCPSTNESVRQIELADNGVLLTAFQASSFEEASNAYKRLFLEPLFTIDTRTEDPEKAEQRLAQELRAFFERPA